MKMDQTLALAIAIATASAAMAQAPRYRATMITENGVFHGFNNLGQVSISRRDQGFQSGVWSQGGWTPTSASGPINDRGEIFTQQGARYGIYNLGTGQIRFITPAVSYHFTGFDPFDINNSGVVSGDYNYLGNAAGAYSWAGELTSPISSNFEGRVSSGVLLNDRNESAAWIGALGYSVLTRSDGTREPVRAGGVTPVSVADLSNSGELLTFTSSSSAGYLLGANFAVLHTLGGLFGRESTAHTRMNMARQVVGYAYTANAGYDESAVATYWSPSTGTVRLDSLIEGGPTGLQLSSGVAINESGQIVVAEYLDFGPSGARRTRYYLLEPVPEPASLVALGLGIFGLLRRRKSLLTS